MRATRTSEVSSVSAPTNAATVVGRPPASAYRRLTGATGTPASTAAWNSAGRNGPPAAPHQVVPSGNAATTAPVRSAAATEATVAGRVRGLVRSR